MKSRPAAGQFQNSICFGIIALPIFDYKVYKNAFYIDIVRSIMHIFRMKETTHAITQASRPLEETELSFVRFAGFGQATCRSTKFHLIPDNSTSKPCNLLIIKGPLKSTPGIFYTKIFLQ